MSAFALNDNELEEGRAECVEDAAIDDYSFSEVLLPTFNWDDLQEALRLQENDETIGAIIDFIMNARQAPEKTAALGYSLTFSDF